MSFVGNVVVVFSSAECVLGEEFMCEWMCGAFGMHACNEIFR